MSLPRNWVDHLFTRLSSTYGTAFMSQYKDLDLELVKADWADFLAQYEQHPKALSFALDNLPADKPVNALQFRNLCRAAPRPEAPALPPPAVDPAVVARGREKLKELAKQVRWGQPDPISVLRNLEAKQNRCEKLSWAQSDWLRHWYTNHPPVSDGEVAQQ